MNHDFKVGGFITKAFGLVNGMLPSAFFFPQKMTRVWMLGGSDSG